MTKELSLDPLERFEEALIVKKLFFSKKIIISEKEITIWDKKVTEWLNFMDRRFKNKF